MIRNITYVILIITVSVFAGNAGVKYSAQPPQGYTGSEGATCVDCHSSFGLNTGGGSITASGLPTGMYNAGQQYNFSLTIAHPTSRSRWGFSISARDANNNPVGTFTSTNANADPNGDELSHGPAVSSTGTSYTYNNLRWTAPATPGAGQSAVTFYYVGNAANGNGNNQGDYIYSASTSVMLPIDLASFTGSVRGTSVLLNWSTKSEQNSSHFMIEKSSDNQHFIQAGRVDASNKSIGATYSYTDDKPTWFDAPTYYRLVMVDKDGSKKLSNVIKLTLQAESNYVKRYYPNPAKAGEQMNIEYLADKAGKATIELFNISGQKVASQDVAVAAGVNRLKTSLGNTLPAGRYSMVVMNGTHRQYLPLVIR